MLLSDGMHRVREEIHHDLVDPGRFCQNGRSTVDLQPHVDRGRRGRAQELRGLFQDGPGQDRSQFHLRLPAEGQYLPDKIACPLGGLYYLPKGLFHLLIMFSRYQGQFRITEDAAEDIVEVVGDAAGQGADGLELLRLPHPVLVHQFVCHIPAYFQVAFHGSARLPEGHDHYVEGDRGPVARLEGHPARPGVPALRASQMTSGGIS